MSTGHVCNQSSMYSIDHVRFIRLPFAPPTTARVRWFHSPQHVPQRFTGVCGRPVSLDPYQGRVHVWAQPNVASPPRFVKQYMWESHYHDRTDNYRSIHVHGMDLACCGVVIFGRLQIIAICSTNCWSNGVARVDQVKSKVLSS